MGTSLTQTLALRAGTLSQGCWLEERQPAACLPNKTEIFICPSASRGWYDGPHRTQASKPAVKGASSRSMRLAI